MEKSFDVVGMGNAIVDVLVSVDDSFLLTHKIAKGVMTLVDEYRSQQIYQAFPPDRREVAGGSAANTMAGVASFGGRGLFVGKVKNDRLGASFAASMNSLGVQFTVKPAEGGPSTACCLIAVAPDGQRSMNTYLGACRGLTAADIDAAVIANAKVLYVEGYLWDVDAAKTATRKAFAAAREAKTKTAFTLSDPFCVGRFRDEFLKLLKNDIDLVFANEEEAKALFGAQEFDEALQQFVAWGGVAAITRSERGCVVVGQGQIHVVDAIAVPQVIDTTGAGDQFAAGFLYGLSHNKSLRTCGKLGALAASEIITHLGARPQKALSALAGEAGLI